LVTGENKDIEFSLTNSRVASLHSIDADKFSESTKFVILSGGYSTEEEALEYGFKVKDAVLCYGVKFRVGVDVGNDRASGFLSKFVKDKIFEEQGVKMIDDVHGVTAYSEEHPTSSISVSATGLINARASDFFADQIITLLGNDIKIADQIKFAMELMTSSFFESSPRSRFLTLILAAESILTPYDRPVEVHALADELKKHAKASAITESDKNSILGSLNWLYKDSISTSLRKMATRYLPGKSYDGIPSEIFIKSCYDARSKLVHSGKVEESEYNIGTLAANLEVYMKDMLTSILCL
jgi:hypothetical protein